MKASLFPYFAQLRSRGMVRSYSTPESDDIALLRDNNTSHMANGGTMADCVVIGLSFGYQIGDGGSILPGPVNVSLAAYIASRFPNNPCVAQHEIADVLQKVYAIVPVKSVESPAGKYLDTRQVLLQAKSYMSEHGLRKAVVVAQSRHVRRIGALSRRLGIEVVFPEELPNSWDSQSAQWWVRASGFWNLREPTVMLHHKLRRWT